MFVGECKLELLVDTRVLEKRQKKNKKSLKIVIFDSQVALVNRSQCLGKKKKEHSRKLGLVAAQRNGIAACAYSLKIFTGHTLLCLTGWFTHKW